MTATFDYVVPASRTVPNLLPESTQFARMPEVLATGYLVGLVEWACMGLLEGHLGDNERTLGTHVDLSHEAPTLPGSNLHIVVELIDIDSRALTFDVMVTDGNTVVCRGRHRRAIVDLRRFEARLSTMQAVPR
ncbi:thioesterase family protein [Gordonia sp. NPDC003376]